MKLIELRQALLATGYPVAYSHFEEEKTPPYIVYLYIDSDDVIADNHNYIGIQNFNVELYTDIKDIAAEKEVELQLKELKLPFDKFELWLEDQRMFQIIYQIQLIGE